MGISLDSLSITSAFNSIISFFKSQENNSKWKDLSSGSEGIFLIRMLANILSNISYRLVTARRENYLSTSNLVSSALGIALNLGYSAHRGTNQKRKIKFEPNGDYVVPPFSVIGNYNGDYDVIYVGEKDVQTHLRDGLVLTGPYILTNVYSMSKLTKTIVLNTDVTGELSVGDTIDITGSVPVEGDEGSDGRYTVASLSVKDRGDGTDTYVLVNEEIPNDCTFSQDCWATRVGIQEFKTVIGKLKTITWTAGTNETQPFTRFEEGISEDYILYLDGEEMPTSNMVRDLNNDTYLVRTNPYSSVDVLYLNHIETQTHKYGSESTFTLKYVELADIETLDYAPQMSGYGTVLDTLTIDDYTPFESIKDIKINAPIDHEVQHLIRSKKDFTQRVQQSVPNIKETAYKAITPTYTLLSYLKDDSTTIPQKDIDKLNASLNEEKYFGTPLPDIAHPVREVINLVIQIFVTDKLKDSNDIRYDINNIIKSNYAKMLNQTFDTYSLERLIEQLSYIKWARVSYDIGEWVSRGITDLGTIIKVGETFYKASKILGVSGGVTPIWNVPIDIIPKGIDLDEAYETQDGSIVWRAYKRLDVDTITKYQTSTQYAIGDYVYDDAYPNFMFKAVDLIKSSGATTSVDTATVVSGDFVADGELIWVCKEYSSYYPTRQPSTPYRLGTSCNIGDKSFEVVSYIGKTGYISPSFEKAYYEIIDYVTPKVIVDYQLGEGGYFLLNGDQRQYFELGSSVTATTDRGESRVYTVHSTHYQDNKDRTAIYLSEEINTYHQPIETYASDIKGSVFYLSGDRRKEFRIGDYIKGLGTKVEISTGKKLNVSSDFTVIDVHRIVDAGGEKTEVMVKGALNSTIKYQELVAAGYTSLQSEYNNSFVLEGKMTDYFTPKSLIKARTDEDAQMTYVVESSVYQGNFATTYVKVRQEISATSSYNRLAPAWKGTSDGEVMWEIVDSADSVSYGWNTYNDINYKSILNH